MLLRNRVLISGLLTLPTLAFPVRLPAQEQQKKELTRYTVEDLGTLGGTFSLAGGMNNRGEIEGFSTLPGDTTIHGFLWRNGVMVDLGTLGGPNSQASFRPSESGRVGGSSDTSTPDPLGEDFCFGTGLICLPFVWQEGVMTPLPTLGGNNGVANGFNSRNQVVGNAQNTTLDETCAPAQFLQVRPVIWEDDAIKEELPTVSGDPDGSALAINDRGQVVGFSGDCTTTFHSVLWQNGTATDLGNLGGMTGHAAIDINNQGQVVGASDLPGDTTFHAFLWQSGAMMDLGTLPGDISSVATGINSKSQVVGGSFDVDGNERAFLWQNGVMTDLNTFIPPDSPLFLIEASGTINARGQIAGIALQQSTGEVHAFLATPREGTNAESDMPATLGAATERPKAILPANVSKMLHQGGALGRRLRRLK